MLLYLGAINNSIGPNVRAVPEYYPIFGGCILGVSLIVSYTKVI